MADMSERPVSVPGLYTPKPKRVGLPEVVPLMLDGVRYDALQWAREQEGFKNGGYLVAVDASSHETLWKACVYVNGYRPDLQTDVQNVFIRSIGAGAGGQGLWITNERGHRFRIDIRTREAASVR